MTSKKEYGFVVYLSKEQKQALEKYANQEDISQAHFVRKAIENRIGERVRDLALIQAKSK